MKAVPRKTSPPSAPIPFVFHAPAGAPMGHTELRFDGRVVAKVFPINQTMLTLRDGKRIQLLDWRWELLNKTGKVVAVGQCRHGEQAQERAWEAAEQRRKKGTL